MAHVNTGLSSGCRMTAEASLLMAMELGSSCPFSAMHSSDVLSLTLSVDNVHFVLYRKLLLLVPHVFALRNYTGSS